MKISKFTVYDRVTIFSIEHRSKAASIMSKYIGRYGKDWKMSVPSKTEDWYTLLNGQSIEVVFKTMQQYLDAFTKAIITIKLVG